MEELKPCPFCGGKAAIYGVDSYYVACCRCEAQTRRYKTAKEAVENWNRRAAPENLLTEDQQEADELIRSLISEKDISPCEWCRRPDKGGEVCKRCYPYEDSNECPSKFTAFSAAPKNKPLTLDQLQQMDGEPVWINADHYGIYADVVNLVGKEDGENWVSFAINTRLRENGYGKTWLAYARKPEGSDSNGQTHS